MILSKGNLYKREEDMKIKDKYIMRLVSTRELNSVVELQTKVYDSLPNKEIFYKDSYEEIYDNLKTGGKIIGVYNSKNHLIAYRHIGFPGKDKTNLGYDINMSTRDLDKVVHLETTVVSPDYRGNDLQSLTLQTATSLVKSQGYEHLLCTISPLNFHSLYNIMKNGLKIKSLKKKYGEINNPNDGLWRFILHRDLNIISYNNPVEFFTSKLHDIEEQTILIDNGFIGYEVEKETRLLNYVKFDNLSLQP